MSGVFVFVVFVVFVGLVVSCLRFVGRLSCGMLRVSECM